MLPGFHTSYWLGLTSDANIGPAFHWSDPFMANTSYEHWGEGQPDGMAQLSTCGTAQAELSFGMPRAWGWAATHCDEPSFVMCKSMGGQLGPVRYNGA